MIKPTLFLIYIFVFNCFSLSQTLRVQRVYGKSRKGVSIPFCIKLQGALLCGKPQQQNSDDLEEQHGSSEASHAENQPKGEVTTSGELQASVKLFVFPFITTLNFVRS